MLKDKTDSPYYHQGKSNSIALIFSCPGNKEEVAGKPISGQTGENFEIVLQSLKDIKIQTFLPYEKRYDFTITNAWTGIQSMSATKRTEATKKQITAPENIQRLCCEIKDIDDYIICFGRKAKLAVENIVRDNLKKSVRVINVTHTSPRTFNKLGNTKEERAKVIAECIIKQMK